MTNKKNRAGTVNLGLPWTNLIRGREVLVDPDRGGSYTGS